MFGIVIGISIGDALLVVQILRVFRGLATFFRTCTDLRIRFTLLTVSANFEAFRRLTMSQITISPSLIGRPAIILSASAILMIGSFIAVRSASRMISVNFFTLSGSSLKARSCIANQVACSDDLFFAFLCISYIK